MTDDDLVKRLLSAPADGLGTENLCIEAADRIEALVAERDEARAGKDEFYRLWREVLTAGYEMKARAEKAEAALREVAEDASVPVHTWKNGINYKKMYESWRKIATLRIDIARAFIAKHGETK